MKKLSVVIALLFVMVSLTAYAANGNCGNGQGRTNVCLSKPQFTAEITGKSVLDIVHHDGLVVDSGSKLC